MDERPPSWRSWHRKHKHIARPAGTGEVMVTDWSVVRAFAPNGAICAEIGSASRHVIAQERPDDHFEDQAAW